MLDHGRSTRGVWETFRLPTGTTMGERTSALAYTGHRSKHGQASHGHLDVQRSDPLACRQDGPPTGLAGLSRPIQTGPAGQRCARCRGAALQPASVSRRHSSRPRGERGHAPLRRLRLRGRDGGRGESLRGRTRAAGDARRRSRLVLPGAARRRGAGESVDPVRPRDGLQREPEQTARQRVRDVVAGRRAAALLPFASSH